MRRRRPQQIAWLGWVTLALIPVGAAGAAARGWPAWRGARGDGQSADVPAQIKAAKLLWKKPMAGPCSAGITARDGYVVVPDGDKKNDYYRCYDAQAGKELWTCTVANGADLDYGPAPRATPPIHAGKVYCLGSTGDLRCLDLKTGKALWKRHYKEDFDAGKLPTWGHCTAPRIIDGRLIVHPGKLYALDPNTGKVLWKGESTGPNYSNFLVGTFGGVRQIIGYDSRSLRGWNAATGKLIWEMEVDNSMGYIVPQPVAVGDRLLVTSESEDTRLYGFGQGGKLIDTPLAESEEIAPEMATPTVAGDVLLGITEGLICLDPANKLKLLWIEEDVDAFYGLSHIVAGNGRALVFGEDGTMVLVQPERKGCKILTKIKLARQTWTHPALVGGRLYLRDGKALYCYELVTE